MRSSPLVSLAVVAGGFALASVPLARLTGAEGARRADAGADTAAASDGSSVRSLLRVRYAHEPERVALTHEGSVIAEFSGPWDAARGQVERDVTIRLPEGEPLEVMVEAEWPAGTPPTALGVEWEPDGLETRRRTAWTEVGSLAEALTFSWP